MRLFFIPPPPGTMRDELRGSRTCIGTVTRTNQSLKPPWSVGGIIHPGQWLSPPVVTNSHHFQSGRVYPRATLPPCRPNFLSTPCERLRWPPRHPQPSFGKFAHGHKILNRIDQFSHPDRPDRRLPPRLPIQGCRRRADSLIRCILDVSRRRNTRYLRAFQPDYG